jgi:hypothetical protein
MTSPAHALVDTGAQVGLWHFQRWLICLAKLYNLRPRYIPLPKICEAGGIGGAAKAVALCDVPTGLASLSGITRWLVTEDPNSNEKAYTPPLMPIKLLKDLDAIIEPKTKKMTFRSAGVFTNLEDLPSEHQTASLMHFGPDGWCIPKDIEDKAICECKGNPFVFDPEEPEVGHQPDDSRFNINKL